MHILTLALVSLLALARLAGAPLPAASGSEAWRSPSALLDGDGKGGGDDGDDEDEDDDDEDVRALG
ncbi:hypothetical protein NR798_07465 [Archangium gephyra]|uniref:hypothetical protein n=1 Tax=Archangium gephyra TaxID=48 RepID=UPI0035D51DE9